MTKLKIPLNEVSGTIYITIDPPSKKTLRRLRKINRNYRKAILKSAKYLRKSKVKFGGTKLPWEKD